MIRDPHARLLRALSTSAAAHGVSLDLRDVAERAWSSATFTGSRLTLTLGVVGGDSAAWLAMLPEDDLPVPGRLVADLVVLAAADGTATLEVLLLEA